MQAIICIGSWLVQLLENLYPLNHCFFHQNFLTLVFPGPTNDRQNAVVSAFKHSWKAYKEHAWGKDQLKPISKTSHTWFDLGLTLIDSLDTMYIMGLTQGKHTYHVYHGPYSGLVLYCMEPFFSLIKKDIRIHYTMDPHISSG